MATPLLVVAPLEALKFLQGLHLCLLSADCARL
jgi:hypothetical protein